MAQKPEKQDYPILKPFRLNGLWWKPDAQKTIVLLPSQASMLMLNGKIGKPATATVTKKEGK